MPNRLARTGNPAAAVATPRGIASDTATAPVEFHYSRKCAPQLGQLQVVIASSARYVSLHRAFLEQRLSAGRALHLIPLSMASPNRSVI
jgi:hypothetical protein